MFFLGIIIESTETSSKSRIDLSISFSCFTFELSPCRSIAPLNSSSLSICDSSPLLFKLFIFKICISKLTIELKEIVIG